MLSPVLVDDEFKVHTLDSAQITGFQFQINMIETQIVCHPVIYHVEQDHDVPPDLG